MCFHHFPPSLFHGSLSSRDLRPRFFHVPTLAVSLFFFYSSAKRAANDPSIVSFDADYLKLVFNDSSPFHLALPFRLLRPCFSGSASFLGLRGHFRLAVFRMEISRSPFFLYPKTSPPSYSFSLLTFPRDSPRFISPRFCFDFLLLAKFILGQFLLSSALAEIYFPSLDTR